MRTELLSFGTTYLAWAFTGITTLNFLGLAGDPSIPEWGVLLNTGRSYLIQAPHLVLLPGVLISLTILSFYAIGEWFSNERVIKRETIRVGKKNNQEEAL
jgi:ABC-type dipeptide/oligopeptide/nickel transport system permease subunit